MDADKLRIAAYKLALARNYRQDEKIRSLIKAYLIKEQKILKERKFLEDEV